MDDHGERASPAEIKELHARLAELDHYEVLGLESDAAPLAIQPAFHRFSERFHPDRHVGADDATREATRSLFARGAEAYRVLKHHRLRAEYDLALLKERRSKSEAPGPRTLDQLCTTSAGKLQARNALRALDEGRLQDAHASLQRAIQAEPPNPELGERLSSIRLLLELSGQG
ncbi:MAG TPA: DnaJ domain-containing protein [Polyangiaceae bacterium]|nr:DnaJ domain-containing protein [Polyangiaceae bacterium]